uniref:Uncharacterized protein n=1 Tax=Ciona intestinalis TaxID=7719 RepID=H2XUG3_CIOIN
MAPMMDTLPVTTLNKEGQDIVMIRQQVVVQQIQDLQLQ